MQINSFKSQYLESNMYVITEGRHSIIIDPCVITEDDVNAAGIIDLILLTHEHFDHISGVNYWKERTGAPVLCNKACAKSIIDPKLNLSHHFDVFCSFQSFVKTKEMPSVGDYMCKADLIFDKNYEMDWKKHRIVIVSCPGHSDGSVLIIVDDKYLFSGDTILKDYQIECGFPGGSKKKWRNEGLLIVRTLDKQLKVFPGHFESFMLWQKMEKGYV